ncbi:uncharacterized protein LOC134272083 isoform X2 [Saccostrea cucullata]|uniref:uncharacterized protein LOC134272083 isoform X2 n=1 Tax=Saccostrea cuccullata TaxID=36930 RepID=UPI002ED160F7
MIRTIAFGLGVIQGMLVARQLFGAQGLNQWYPFNRVQMEQALVALTGKMLKTEDQQAPKVDTMAEIFAKLIYQNCVLTYSDMDYVEACVKNVLNSLYQDSTGSLVLGSVAIPTPPANVDPVDFGQWYEDNVDEEFTLGALQLHSSVEREAIDSEATGFIRNLDLMFETQTMEAGDVARSQEGSVNIMRLRSSLDMCAEEIPKLLELGQVGDMIKHDYDFPYHVPSLISLATVSSSQMPETIGYCLLQECLWMNNSICHMRQQIHDLQGSLLAGPEAIPQELLPTACCLQEEHVPVSWIHPNCQPSTHSLVSWLEDLKKRYKQLHTWVKHSMVPVFKDGILENPTIAAGRLGKVWLGGLVNPQALLVAIRQEKAIVAHCSMSEISFECIVLDNVNTDDYDVDEGGMFVSDLNLQGAAWDYENDCLKDPSSSLYNIPYIYMKPVIAAEQADKVNQQTIYSCPIFMNKSRQVQTTEVSLNCPVPVEKWKLARVALILDPGLPVDGTKKSRSYMMLMKAPMMPIQEEESIHSDEEEEELIELEQGEEVENSEQSQMSYRPMSPKAPPLPPGLALQKEPPMGGEQPIGETEKKSSVKGSKDSVYSQGKSEGKKGSRVGTPTKGSERSGQQSPVAKPGSRPPTRASVTSKKSRGKDNMTSEEDVHEQKSTSRPRSEHEDPVTQVEIEHSEDEAGEGTDRKNPQQTSDRSSEGNQNQNAMDKKKSESVKSLKKSESSHSLKKGESTKSLKKGESTQSLKKGESTQSLKKGESTQSLKKGESTQSLKKGSSHSSGDNLYKAKSKESLKKAPSGENFQKTESKDNIHDDQTKSSDPPTSRTVEDKQESEPTKSSGPPSNRTEEEKKESDKAKSSGPPSNRTEEVKQGSDKAKSSGPPSNRTAEEKQASDKAKSSGPPSHRTEEEKKESDKAKSSGPPTNRTEEEKQASDKAKSSGPPTNRTEEEKRGSEKTKTPPPVERKDSDYMTETKTTSDDNNQKQESSGADDKQPETSKEQEPAKEGETTLAKDKEDSDLM